MTESKVDTTMQRAKPRKHAIIFLNGRKLVWSVSNGTGGILSEGVSEGTESCILSRGGMRDVVI
jgi:hypothetical protein